jgi:hypothetical protein
MEAEYTGPVAGVAGILVTHCNNRRCRNTRLQNDSLPTSSGNTAGVAFFPFDRWNPTRDSPTEGEKVMKRRTLITTAIVGALSLGLLTAAPALAEGPGYGGGRGAKMFDRFDTNDDGSVNRRELRGGQHARFQKMDLNRNGRVTQHEARKATRQVHPQDWNRGGQGVHHARFAKRDLNRDGRVTQREFRSGQHARFQKTDLNRDGRVTQHEARKAKRQVRAQDWGWDRDGRG